MTLYRVRKTANLRRGRYSQPFGRYFVTACIADRRPIFSDAAVASRALRVVDEMELAGDWQIEAVNVMPDHVHLLFRLGERLSFTRVLAKFKTLTRANDWSWDWQENAYERRVRDHENAADYAFYIFMNPYCAELIDCNTPWPWWRSGAFRWQFEDGLNANGCPPQEWLRDAEAIRKKIHL